MILFEIYAWGILGMGFIMGYVIKYHMVIVTPPHMRWVTWLAVIIMMVCWVPLALGFILFLCKKCIKAFQK